HPGRPEADDRETGPRTGTGTRAVEDLRPLPVVVHVGRTVRAGHEGTGDSVLPEPSAAQVPQRGTLCGPGPVSGVVSERSLDRAVRPQGGGPCPDHFGALRLKDLEEIVGRVRGKRPLPGG